METACTESAEAAAKCGKATTAPWAQQTQNVSDHNASGSAKKVRSGNSMPIEWTCEAMQKRSRGACRSAQEGQLKYVFSLGFATLGTPLFDTSLTTPTAMVLPWSLRVNRA